MGNGSGGGTSAAKVPSPAMTLTARGSLQRRALGEFRPFGNLALEERVELLGRAADKTIAEGDRLLLDVGQRQDALHVGIDLGDDRLRRGLGREERVPRRFAELDAL